MPQQRIPGYLLVAKINFLVEPILRMGLRISSSKSMMHLLSFCDPRYKLKESTI